MKHKIKSILAIIPMAALILPINVNAASCKTVKYHYLFTESTNKVETVTNKESGVPGSAATEWGTKNGLSSNQRRVLFESPKYEIKSGQFKQISADDYVQGYMAAVKLLARDLNKSIVDLDGNLSAVSRCVQIDSDYYCINDGNFSSSENDNSFDDLTKVLYQMYYYSENGSDSCKREMNRLLSDDFFNELNSAIINSETNFSISLGENNGQIYSPYQNTSNNKIGFYVNKSWSLNQTNFNKLNNEVDSEKHLTEKGINLFKYNYNMSRSCNNGEAVFGYSADEIDANDDPDDPYDNEEEGTYLYYAKPGTYNCNGDTCSKFVGYMVADYQIEYNECDAYTIRYDANGGENAPASQTKNEGETIRLSTQKPTRDGYTFLGWSTNKNATSKDSTYDPGSSYSKDANLTLYAVWQNNSAVDGKPSDNDQNSPQTGVGIGLGIIALSLIGGTAGIIYVNKSSKFNNI